MTSLHPRLAGLLRVAAEKEPEKFQVEQWEVSDRFTTSGDDGWEVRLDRLDDPGAFPCDCMDAIAGALGMEFEVRRIQRHCWAIEVFDDVTPISGDLDDSKHPTKRSASIAALCAILEHRYGPTTGETK